MSVAAATVLAALLGVPAFSGDRETDAERRARLMPLAEAIAETPGEELVAALVTTAVFESRLARFIGADDCAAGPAGMRCDADEFGVPRALGYLQLWRVACPAAWELEPGPERLRVEVGCARARLLERAQACRRSRDGAIAGMLAGYVGACENPAGRRRRASFEAFRDVVVSGGWPSAPGGWMRSNAARPPGSRRVLERLLASPARAFEVVELGGKRFGALVEWHWTEGRGFHKGVSLFTDGNS